MFRSRSLTGGLLGRPHLISELLCRGSVSAICGSVLGVIISLVVNCTLVEISLSSFFSLYFGVLFITVGCVILWRLNTSKSIHQGDEIRSRQLQLTFFSVLIFISGALCFILKRNWFVGLSPVAKVPIYTVLGVSVSFALTFTIIDLLNCVVGLIRPQVAKTLIDSKSQVYVIMCITLLMGGIFGFIFGVMDVEDSLTYQIKLVLLREQHFCYPIGAILGAAAGFANEIVKHQEEQHAKMRNSLYENDI